MAPLNLNLNGQWQFRKRGSRAWLSALVPGCVHTDLFRNKIIANPLVADNELKLEWIEKCDWEYRRSFNISQQFLQHEHIELVADGLDTVAIIKINGQPIAETCNMFIGYRFDIKQFLRKGENVIYILFESPLSYINNNRKNCDFDPWNDPVGGCSVIRKQQCSFGWDWAPRFATSGIYRPIRIEAWNCNRIEHVYVRQFHKEETVKLHIKVSPSQVIVKPLRQRITLSFRGIPIVSTEGNDIVVPQPKLWWPNKLGEQQLYNLNVELIDGHNVLDSWQHNIGLRTVVLERSPDQWGESFKFLINNRPIFAKGANWIPAHIFPSETTPKMYEKLLTSAARSNINMLRVWGGGIYESDIFYETCDKLGILVWHDFMFSCSLYPGNDTFLDSVKKEAEYQLRRLRNHPCIALWCGNNEIEQMPTEIVKTEQRKKAYEDLFYRLLPAAVQKYSPDTPYWPSSPHNPQGYQQGVNSEQGGDAHIWDVWHGRHPVERYFQFQYRFVSEFGMQSYCSEETASNFSSKVNLNVWAPEFENHQKNPAGNSIIMEYLSRRYRFPKDYRSLAYISQLNQAYCIKSAVEHHRRSMPRTMGSLYWQLNDCWPSISWSSIEFGGRWKALHYAAVHFFAPITISIQLIGTESYGKINRRINTITGVKLWTISDSLATDYAVLHWTLFHVEGWPIATGKKNVTLNYCEAVEQQTIHFDKEFKKYGKSSLVLRVWLEKGNKILSEDSALFCAPRFIEIPQEKISPKILKESDTKFVLIFKTNTYQHQVSFHLSNIDYYASDNFFDLFPAISHKVVVTTDRKVKLSDFRKALQIMCYRDCYC